MNHKFRGIFKMPFSLGVLLAATLFLAGCSATQKEFALVSHSENPEITAPRSDTTYVKGEECSWMILYLPTNSQNTSPEGAVRNAMDKASRLGYVANALTNVKIKYYGASFLGSFLMKECYTAEGYPANVELH